MLYSYFYGNNLNLYFVYILGFTTSLILSVFCIKYIIKIFRKNAYQNYVKKYYTRDILHKKFTPTSGGIAIIFATILSNIIFNRIFFNKIILNILFIFVSFGILGYIDDLLKIRQKNSDGLKAKTKLLMQTFIVLISYCLYNKYYFPDRTYISFFPLDYRLDLGNLYKIFYPLLIIGYSNATNLTDGIDGLLSTLTIHVLIAIILIIYFFQNKNLINLDLESLTTMLIFSITLLGAVIGFLWFNSKPADIFMGDSGSLAIGGTIAIISIYLQCELLILCLGLIFCIEVFSVILQVIYFKYSKGRRIFLMSPLHHHFQKKGISDSKILSKFAIISMMIVIFILGYIYLVLL